jgi:uncharacterized protein YbjT (DUF2867 family)
MPPTPIIVVFAATGKTGGNVKQRISPIFEMGSRTTLGGAIDAILADGTFVARAVTRNPESDAAKGSRLLFSRLEVRSDINADFLALAVKGVEVIKADLDEPPSLEIAYVVFLGR